MVGTTEDFDFTTTQSEMEPESCAMTHQQSSATMIARDSSSLSSRYLREGAMTSEGVLAHRITFEHQ